MMAAGVGPVMARTPLPRCSHHHRAPRALLSSAATHRRGSSRIGGPHYTSSGHRNTSPLHAKTLRRGECVRVRGSSTTEVEVVAETPSVSPAQERIVKPLELAALSAANAVKSLRYTMKTLKEDEEEVVDEEQIAKVKQLLADAEALVNSIDEERASITGLPVNSSTSLKSTAEAINDIVPKKEHVSEKDIQWAYPSDSVPFWQVLEDKVAVQSGSPPLTRIFQDSDRVHVVHITAEMAPIAKVGGLGDVVTGLSRSCVASGHQVEVVLPFYECINEELILGLQPDSILPRFQSYHKGDMIDVECFSGLVSGVTVLFLKPANHFFNGGKVYGGNYNELEAYLFFCRASLEMLYSSGRQPDILHMHEWHTAAVGMLYWDIYYKKGFNKPRLVMTIHNMDHSGECRGEELAVTGLNPDDYMEEDKALDERTRGHNPERMCLLKAGVVYANAVTTVSPTYRKESLEGQGGYMGKILKEHEDKYQGILNGIDASVWDPQNDLLLPTTFSSQKLEGKAICKKYLQRALGLKEDPKIPLVACVTRLVPQKGVHLIKHATHVCKEQNAQYVLLGTGHLQGDFENLGHEHNGGDQIRMMVMYSEALAHTLYAAADIVLVPSMFEPCGLTQLVALRYGAVPLVRRTGGLADTVRENPEDGNGFIFDGIDEGSFEAALKRALDAYDDETVWTQIVQRGMQDDNSWNRSARSYLDLYRGVL